MSEIDLSPKLIHRTFFSVEKGYKTLSESVYTAAQVAELLRLERERCATLAEAHFIPGHSVAGPQFAAVLASAIRALSDEVKP